MASNAALEAFGSYTTTWMEFLLQHCRTCPLTYADYFGSDKAKYLRRETELDTSMVMVHDVPDGDLAVQLFSSTVRSLLKARDPKWGYSDKYITVRSQIYDARASALRINQRFGERYMKLPFELRMLILRTGTYMSFAEHIDGRKKCEFCREWNDVIDDCQQCGASFCDMCCVNNRCQLVIANFLGVTRCEEPSVLCPDCKASCEGCGRLVCAENKYGSDKVKDVSVCCTKRQYCEEHGDIEVSYTCKGCIDRCDSCGTIIRGCITCATCGLCGDNLCPDCIDEHNHDD